jgi:diacylglycerol O-acyltransferase / wax synthase
MALHKMAPVDAAWFHMDGSANLAMVTSVILTREPLDFAKVKALYAARVPQFPRFAQRVVERGLPIALPHWEDMPDFDVGQHLHHVALPAPHDKRALAAMLSDIVSMPLDPLQPLWQVHVIDGIEGGSALVTRFHHCIGDGTAMSAFAAQLFDTRPGVPAAKTLEVPAQHAAGEGGWLDSAFDWVGSSAKAVVAAANTALDVVRHPKEVIDKAAAVASGAGMVLAELLKTDDPESPFKGRFQLAKRVAWSEPVAIDDVKAIGALAGAKVNDVLVAGMTGALRAYLKGRGVDVDHTTLRAMVPVDLRSPERALELGNDFGLVILELAVDTQAPLERLRVTKEHMDALKRSPEPVAMRVILDIFGRTPKVVSDIPSSMFSSKASLVMTNVVGSAQTLYVAGVPIERMMFWVPHPGEHLGLGVSILSYRGQATLAVVADAHLVPDPETITALLPRPLPHGLDLRRHGAGRRHRLCVAEGSRTSSTASTSAPPTCRSRSA